MRTLKLGLNTPDRDQKEKKTLCYGSNQHLRVLRGIDLNAIIPFWVGDAVR